ncbi:MAG: hypothetical protein Q4D22_01325 [Candidatus Saccharibacteria bacterium]|nr:hypothetical protein [Candidatus Saccharibacteria bacterium]
MQKQKNFQLAVIGVLAFAVIFMSVGFAAYSQTLNINGTTTVQGNKWSVHFDTATFQRAEGSVVETSKSVSNTSITYAATLEKPGNKFAFTIDVVNDGTFDATLNKITLSTLTEEQAKYLKYTLVYDNDSDNPYTATTSGLSIGLPHTTGSNRKPVMVVVEYVAPDNADDLPESSVAISLTAALDYVQAE